MSRVIGEGSGTAAVVIGSIVSIIAATRGTAMVILLPLGLFYGRVQRLFRRVTTELTRLESIAKSPVFAGFSEMLVGQDVIRAFGMVGNMLNDHCRAIDSQSLCTVYKLHATQWLRLRLEVQGAITCAFIAFVAVVSSDGFLPAGWVALALSSAFEMTIFLQAAVNCMAQLEGNFSSVERIQVYAKELKRRRPNTRPTWLNGARRRARYPCARLSCTTVRALRRPWCSRASRSALRAARRSASWAARVPANRA